MGYKPPTDKIIIKRKAGDRTAQCGALGRPTHTHRVAEEICMVGTFRDDLSDWSHPYVPLVQDYF